MRQTGWLLGGAAVLILGAATGSIALIADADGDADIQSSDRSAISAPIPASTLPPLPSTSTVAPTVPPTAPPPTPSTSDDRLASSSRLGYAGLGPIKLGMSYTDVERVGGVTLRQSDCPLVMTPDSGRGLDPVPGPYGGTITGFSAWTAFPITEPRTIDEIDILHPAIYTISGIHVGSTADDVRRTYANVKESNAGQDSDQRFWRALIITNPEGTAIEFMINPDGFVYSMSLGVNADIFANHRLC